MFVRVLITGLVQGVTFRWAVPAGSGAVEIHAEGPDDQVKAFLDALGERDGVKRLDTQVLEDFEIVF